MVKILPRPTSLLGDWFGSSRRNSLGQAFFLFHFFLGFLQIFFLICAPHSFIHRWTRFFQTLALLSFFFFSQPCPLLLCSQHLINSNHWRPLCRSFNFSVKASSFACWNFDFFSLLFSSVRHSSKSETSLATMLYSCLMGILALAESGRASRTGIAADCLVLLVMAE